MIKVKMTLQSAVSIFEYISISDNLNFVKVILFDLYPLYARYDEGFYLFRHLIDNQMYMLVFYLFW